MNNKNSSNLVIAYNFEKDEIKLMTIKDTKLVDDEDEIIWLTIPSTKEFYIMRINATAISDFDFRFVEKIEGENIIKKYIRDYLCTNDEIITKIINHNLEMFDVLEKETILLDANLCSFSLYHFIRK